MRTTVPVQVQLPRFKPLSISRYSTVRDAFIPFCILGDDVACRVRLYLRNASCVLLDLLDQLSYFVLMCAEWIRTGMCDAAFGIRKKWPNIFRRIRSLASKDELFLKTSWNIQLHFGYVRTRSITYQTTTYIKLARGMNALFWSRMGECKMCNTIDSFVCNRLCLSTGSIYVRCCCNLFLIYNDRVHKFKKWRSSLQVFIIQFLIKS